MRYCRAQSRITQGQRQGGAADAPTRSAGIEPGGPSALPMALRRAAAQSKYPERPIRLVIRSRPGGVYDAVGRPWADRVKPIARHRGGREHRRRRRFVGRGRGRACRRPTATPFCSAAAVRWCSLRSRRAGRRSIRCGISSRSRSWSRPGSRSWFIPSLPVEDARRIDRLRQSQSRQAVLRVGGRRLDEPAHRRTVQVAQRCR